MVSPRVYSKNQGTWDPGSQPTLHLAEGLWDLAEGFWDLAEGLKDFGVVPVFFAGLSYRGVGAIGLLNIYLPTP